MKKPDSYQPQEVEAQIYSLWQKSGAFGAKKTGPPFVMILPPPNANADLHLGHALDFGLKDVVGRWQRQKGAAVWLVVGADHAGFETWAVYEKHLNEKGQSRFDFSQKELYDQVAAFVETNKSKMISQIKSLGISCDWDNFVFSLDDQVVERTKKTFAALKEQGLIYRGRRLVNYCLKHQTGFADREVEYQELKGQLYYLKYPLVAKEGGFLELATTRPETLLADVAIAGHPDDQRYQKLRQKMASVPLVGRSIPIVFDREVDPGFGSGLVKITPGCDFFDADLAARQEIGQIFDLVDQNGRLSNQDWLPPIYRGLSLEEARKMVVADLQAGGFLQKIEEISHRVGVCYKCQSRLEPIRQEQWFVSMEPLAKRAIESLKNNEIKFYPDSKRLELIAYLSQLKDWNISRQIAWGITIPAAQNENNPSDWIFCPQTKEKEIIKDGQKYRLDQDVFDTWWSSSQWPFAAIGYPQKNSQAYPGALMETGTDLLRAWVSRMIMLALLVTDQVPFRQVYLHGMITDSTGAKMSKSKGNVVNPMEVVSEFGADALRVGLLTGTAAGQPQSFSLSKVAAGRNLCNKIYNIQRFLESISGKNGKNTADDWIWWRFKEAKAELDRALGEYRFSEALSQVSNFIWHDLADWYVETNKRQPHYDNLRAVFLASLKLIHPFSPFVSEHLYQKMGEKGLLINQTWADGEIASSDSSKAAEFEKIKSLVIRIRRIKKHFQKRLTLILEEKNSSLAELVGQLAQIKNIALVEPETPNRAGLQVAAQGEPLAWLEIDQEGRKQLQTVFQKQAIELKEQIKNLTKRLKNPAYSQKAPKEMVAESREQLKNCQEQLRLASEISDQLISKSD